MSSSTVLAPEIEKFRATVDQIPYLRDAILLKTYYLTASREVELLTKVSPWEMLHKATKPYGIYLKFSIEDFDLPPTKENPIAKEKVLLIVEAIAKRMKGKKKVLDTDNLTTQQIADYLPENMRAEYVKDTSKFDPVMVKAFLGQITFKSIALPCSPRYEPWTIDLLKYIKANGRLSFDLTRQRVWQIYRSYLSTFLKTKGVHNIKNPLRHFRISHLIEHYAFDPFDVTIYSGWTFGTTFAAMGVQASPQLSAYAHLQWKKYFPKLLREL